MDNAHTGRKEIGLGEGLVSETDAKPSQLCLANYGFAIQCVRLFALPWPLTRAHALGIMLKPGSLVARAEWRHQSVRAPSALTVSMWPACTSPFRECTDATHEKQQDTRSVGKGLGADEARHACQCIVEFGARQWGHRSTYY